MNPDQFLQQANYLENFTEREDARCADVVSLDTAPINKNLRICRLDAGRNAYSRLSSMGIVPGVQIKIIRRDADGPLLLEVKGTRIALGRGLGLKVMVCQD